MPPVEKFKERLDAYPGLFDAVKKIEGLPTNASIHASALYVFNNGYLAQNSLMRAPNKTPISARINIAIDSEIKKLHTENDIIINQNKKIISLLENIKQGGI